MEVKVGTVFKIVVVIAILIIAYTIYSKYRIIQQDKAQKDLAYQNLVNYQSSNYASGQNSSQFGFFDWAKLMGKIIAL